MKYILLFLLFSYTNTFAQEFTAGLIMPTETTENFKPCCVYIPESGLKIYKQPNSYVVGNIYLGKGEPSYYPPNTQIEKDGIVKRLDYSNYEQVGNEIYALEFVNLKDDFVQLNNGYWLSVKELTSKDLTISSWLSYAIEKNEGWHANDPGLNLRTGFSTDHKKLITLKGEKFQITLTTQTKGKWGKVFVEQYNKPPCSGKTHLVRTYSGWVKLISEDGTLNIDKPPRGC